MTSSKNNNRPAPARKGQALSTTPAAEARMVDAKTRYCQFCGNRFCGIFRHKHECPGCGGNMCGGCSIRPKVAKGDLHFRVCPGCDVRLSLSPTFVGHIKKQQAKEENEEKRRGSPRDDLARPRQFSDARPLVSEAEFPTEKPKMISAGIAKRDSARTTEAGPLGVESPSSSLVCHSRASSPSSPAGPSSTLPTFTSCTTQTPPCLVFTPSPSFAATATTARLLGSEGYAIHVTTAKTTTKEAEADPTGVQRQLLIPPTTRPGGPNDHRNEGCHEGFSITGISSSGSGKTKRREDDKSDICSNRGNTTTGEGVDRRSAAQPSEPGRGNEPPQEKGFFSARRGSGRRSLGAATTAAVVVLGVGSLAALMRYSGRRS